MVEVTGSALPQPAPPFAEFYEAVNGRQPFPWQSRLAAEVAGGDGWPQEVGVPTGLGKTACLEVAIWWLASQAHLPPDERIAPTRIWWIVNRRLLVDSTWQHAERISGLLSAAAVVADVGTTALNAIESVAVRLRSLAVDAGTDPLEVIRLRGGVAWRRPTDPSQPAVILSTIPMYGSRLLFRGYGSSRSMRPVDAALAGTDSLVLVDEAHLARHLMNLFPALKECAPAQRGLLNPSRAVPRVVSLTATGSNRGRRFELDAADESHPEIARRLDAAKPTEIRVHDKPGQVRPLAEAAVSLLQSSPRPASCLIFVNSPDTARAVKHRLASEKGSGVTADDIVVLTGRTREREAAAARTRILSEMRAGVDRGPRSRHLVVVATQTLEVGADIDAELLVTESCGVRALIQRFGRLNRLGRHPAARAVYVHCPPARGAADGWPVYGNEPELVLERLRSGAGDGDTVDLAPRGIAAVLGAPADDHGRAPEVLPALLWEWTKTTIPPAGEAPVEPYFSGIVRPERSVSLIWRVHVPGTGERLWPRPREEEFLDVSIGAFRQALGELETLSRLGADAVSIEEVHLAEVRPGDQIVLPADRGLIDADGWNPAATRVVADLSLLPHGLPLEQQALRRLCDDPTGSDRRLPTERLGQLLALVVGEGDEEEIDEGERFAALERLVDLLAQHPPRHLTDADYREADLADWGEFIAGLNRDLPPDGPRREVPRLVRKQATAMSHVVELDEMSLAETATELDLHGDEVGTRAARLAAVLGLPTDLVAILQRAGSFHDVGKADLRFQRWLDPRAVATSPVAKSALPRARWATARTAAGWPAGGRHEDLSARLVAEWIKTADAGLADADADLLVHLVISHHGKGRPLVPPVEDGSPTLVSYEIEGVAVSSSADLSIVDWSQPARFRRLNDLYGPWGLALLEAIIRQADHAVSAGARVRELEVH